MESAMKQTASSRQATLSGRRPDPEARSPCNPGETSWCDPPEPSIGFANAAEFDANRAAVNPVAFQAAGQTEAFYADSSRTVADRKNVRDGHYPLWGYVHLIARTTSGVLSPQAADLAGWITDEDEPERDFVALGRAPATSSVRDEGGRGPRTAVCSAHLRLRNRPLRVRSGGDPDDSGGLHPMRERQRLQPATRAAVTASANEWIMTTLRNHLATLSSRLSFGGAPTVIGGCGSSPGVQTGARASEWWRRGRGRRRRSRRHRGLYCGRRVVAPARVAC